MLRMTSLAPRYGTRGGTLLLQRGSIESALLLSASSPCICMTNYLLNQIALLNLHIDIVTSCVLCQAGNSLLLLNVGKELLLSLDVIQSTY